MAKFYEPIGYAETTETSPGVWREGIIEYNYSGDVIKNMSRSREGENLNDNIIIDNRLSILADPFAYENFHTMRYIKWLGALWKITAVEIQRPRLLLTIGGIYNSPHKLAVPVAPTFTQLSNTLVIPSSTGVAYSINDVTKAAGTYAITTQSIVRARPTEYYFAPNTVKEWTFEYVPLN